MSEKRKKSKDNVIDESPEAIIRAAIAEAKGNCRYSAEDGRSCSSETVHIVDDIPPHQSLHLTKNDLLHALRIMILARKSDEKHLMLVKQGKSFFHIGGSGHEAVQAAIGMSLTQKKDWGWTYYRDSAFMYSMGYKPEEYFLLAFGKAEDPSSGGRQMPGHFGHAELNLPSQSSSTGTQFLNAVGTALASKLSGKDEIVYVASGEGTTSQGEFYEAVNWASREKLPVLFCVQDNGYAISVPREHQSMGESVGHSFCCYSNLKMKTFDGTDFFESYMAAQESVDYLRRGKGSILLHAYVERLLPHSSSDDQKKYRPAEELEKGKHEKDCILKLKNYLIENKIAGEDELKKFEENIKEEIDNAADWAWQRPDPKAEDAVKQNFADLSSRSLGYSEKEPSEGQKTVLVDAVNHALREEMRFNDKMLIFGEDVADPKGGVFTATKGLSTEFGNTRVFNSPLAEASIIGVALGLAIRGFKPVVEIQFGDYIWPAFMQIKNELATVRFRSNGGFSSPVVIRVAVGGYIHGGLCHSQNIEAFFSHIPGLLIAYPSTAADAKGLLKTACRLQDPVLFCEHKGMYRLPYSTTIEPDENYLIPFGKGKILKNGQDAVIVTWGMGCKDSINAVKKIEQESDKTIKIIDLRTISPWDKDLVIESAKQTHRVLIVHEDTLTMGFGAEISATVNTEAFKHLDAPVIRVAAKDSHIPYAPVYESEILPNESKIYTALKALVNY